MACHVALRFRDYYCDNPGSVFDSHNSTMIFGASSSTNRDKYSKCMIMNITTLYFLLSQFCNVIADEGSQAYMHTFDVVTCVTSQAHHL